MNNLKALVMITLIILMSGCGIFFEDTFGDGEFNPKLKDEYRPLASAIITVIGIEKPQILAKLVTDLRAIQDEVNSVNDLTDDAANRLIAKNLGSKALLYASIPEVQAAYGDVINLLNGTEIEVDQKLEDLDVRIESLIQAIELRILTPIEDS